ncbi:type I-E CRISPR-associated protein Cse1/CasA [Pyramidobacter sp. SM-530-WT-4B]|uniref:Type I-E CRISPR-associated protein Cse1/CasA n=1 Tax=Pyramidobacter porci TaxID=2605789 RepID=A0A6L5YE38_9BACT|nr:type I-E CRISPR-associated protein Cse1/CasA [Pyramidobacter porci]MST56308.1 type I-E CRISPR-associated protein Cse1/CasA [Pyramidobacter porci]
MAVFDVLREPWIPALRMNGSPVSLGILDLLEQAHELKALGSESLLENYSIFRLLAAFLMDAYTPEYIDDRRQILESGHFDPVVLQRYVEQCVAEGDSFNLFDEKRPFMQARYDEKYDKKTVPVAVLVHALPAGNNHIHFDHRLSSEHCLTAAEALRALCAAYVFCTSGLAGPSSVNNTPCIYVVYEGQTLFESLIVSMISKDECESKNIPWSEPPVSWRNDDEVIPKSLCPTVSLMAAFTWLPRRVTFVPVKIDGALCVKEVYCQAGLNFQGDGRWYDPHVPYRKNKKEEWYSVKPQSGRELWRDVGAVTAADPSSSSTRQPLILANYKELTESRTSRLLKVQLIGLVTNQAQYLSTQSDSLALPSSFLGEAALGRLLRSDLQDIETMAFYIFSSYGKILDAEIATELQTQFYAVMYEKLFSEYFPYVAKIDRNQDNWGGLAGEYLDNILKKMRDLVMHQGAQRFASNARALRDMSAAETSFVRNCGSLLKKRRENK